MPTAATRATRKGKGAKTPTNTRKRTSVAGIATAGAVAGPEPDVRLGDLVQDPTNCRKHNPRNIGSIVNSLQAVGAARSIVIDENNVILAGNGMVEAAGEAGITNVRVVEADGNTVIAVRRTGLTAKQKAQLAISDNRTAELAEWDAERLMKTIEEYDLDLAGIEFTQEEIDKLGAESLREQEVTEDEVPEASQVEMRCEAGDLWQLGEHRLLCGDSTKAEDVARLMDGEKVSLCFTSPPYAQQRDYTAEGKVSDWDVLMEGVFSNLPMTDDGQVLVNLGLVHREGEWLPYWDNWIQRMRTLGWRRFGWYVWDQGPGMPGDWNGRFAPSHEFIFHFNKKSVRPADARDCKHAGVSHTGKGQRDADGTVRERWDKNATIQDTFILDSILRVFRQSAPVGAGGHPAPFPVQLPGLIMKSWPGPIYEPFCGSGTTMMAAEQLGQRCFGMEIAPEYGDIILTRWETLTGRKAERLSRVG